MKNKQDDRIIEYLSRVNHAKVEDIASEIYCSASTVRRRLSVLESQGLIIRTHGGATIDESGTLVSDFAYRKDLYIFEKKKIAIAAAKMVKDGDVIFLDDSSTVFYMIPYIAEHKNITVVTNGVDNLQMLIKYNIQAFSTGGKVDPTNKSALIGEYAEATTENTYYDLMFFSVLGVDENGIATDPSSEGNILRRKAMKNARKTVFMMHSEKFGKTSIFRSFALKDCSTVISSVNLRDCLDESLLPEFIYVE